MRAEEVTWDQERWRNEDQREERARMTREERGRLRQRQKEELGAGEEEEHTRMALEDGCGSRRERLSDPRRDVAAALAVDHLVSLVRAGDGGGGPHDLGVLLNFRDAWPAAAVETTAWGARGRWRRSARRRRRATARTMATAWTTGRRPKWRRSRRP